VDKIRNMDDKPWRTAYQNFSSDVSISHKDSILLLGSCFAENIGKKFNYFGFQTQINPTGILYNPISLFNMLDILYNPSKLDKNRFVQRQDHVFHYDFHSDFHAKSENDFTSKITDISSQFLKKPSFLFLTLGTAWIYEYNNKVTGNCHKQETSLFNKRLLSSNEITASLQQIRQLIDPSTRIIITVSPVRHLKDGMVENQLSKSHLVSAVHRFLEINTEGRYFPSYEIMMDDLRDYRFYNSDLLHPNNQAVNYIWECLGKSYFKHETRSLNEEVKAIRNMENHRSFFPESEEHVKFIEKLKLKKQQLLASKPFLRI